MLRAWAAHRELPRGASRSVFGDPSFTKKLIWACGCQQFLLHVCSCPAQNTLFPRAVPSSATMGQAWPRPVPCHGHWQRWKQLIPRSPPGFLKLEWHNKKHGCQQAHGTGHPRINTVIATSVFPSTFSPTWGNYGSFSILCYCASMIFVQS